MASKGKTTKKAMPQVTCEDCGGEYEAGAPHRMFCPARTCTECGTTVGHKLMVYDSRPEAADEDGNPPRLCDNCLEERLDADEA